MISTLWVHADNSQSCLSCIKKCFTVEFSPSPSQGLRWCWAAWSSPDFSSCPFWHRSDTCSIQTSGTSCHDCSRLFESGLIMPSASSLSTHRCSLSGPMDLCTSSLPKCSLTWSSSTEGQYSLFQTCLWSQGFPNGRWDTCSFYRKAPIHAIEYGSGATLQYCLSLSC